jgi:hypothetical protein
MELLARGGVEARRTDLLPRRRRIRGGAQRHGRRSWRHGPVEPPAAELRDEDDDGEQIDEAPQSRRSFGRRRRAPGGIAISPPLSAAGADHQPERTLMSPRGGVNRLDDQFKLFLPKHLS